MCKERVVMNNACARRKVFRRKLRSVGAGLNKLPGLSGDEVSEKYVRSVKDVLKCKV